MRIVTAHRALLAFILSAAPVVAGPGPVVAECIGGWTPMPSFTGVARTAERIIVATVVDELDRLPGEQPTGGVLSSFVLDVDEVLRGPDPGDPPTVDMLRTGARRTGECGGIPLVFVRVGDRVAIAFDGVLPGTHRRGTAAAWIEGRPDALAAPEAEVLTLGQVRRIAATLPDTATADADAARRSLGEPSTQALRIAVRVVAVVPLLGRWPAAPATSGDRG